jgi:G3E family GTPase
VEALRNTCQEQDGADAQPIDRILLETSGLADPGAIAKALSEDPILARRLVLDETIVLVDALHGLAQLNEERLGRRQVEAADRLIITKPGSVAASQLARMASTLRQLNPMALVESAERGTSFALQTVPDAEPYPLADIADDAMPIKPCRLDISGEYGWAAFSVWLSALLAARGEQIMRVKGVVTTADGRLLLQSVRKQVQPPEMLPEMDADSSVQGPRDNIIIFIGRGIDDALLTSAWARFTQDNPGQMRR